MQPDTKENVNIRITSGINRTNSVSDTCRLLLPDISVVSEVVRNLSQFPVQLTADD